MRVARGRGAAHAMEDDAGSARSFPTAGALREVVPPPYRLGVSNPDPCRLFADRGARLAVFFIHRESQTTCSDVVGQDGRFSAGACSLPTLQHTRQREVGVELHGNGGMLSHTLQSLQD